MATIARLVVEISARTAEFQQQMDMVARTTRDNQRQMEASANAVTSLADRFTVLRNAFRTGTISEQDYAGAMRTLKADVAELATQANMTAGSMDRLSRVGAGATREIRNITAVARRGADGFEAFGVSALAASEALMGGMGGVGRAASTLGVFAMGNPALIGILAGITAIASAAMLIKSAFDDAEQSAQAAGVELSKISVTANRAALSILQVRIAGLQAELRASQPATFAAAAAGRPTTFAGIAAANAPANSFASIASVSAPLTAQVALQNQLNEAMAQERRILDLISGKHDEIGRRMRENLGVAQAKLGLDARSLKAAIAESDIKGLDMGAALQGADLAAAGQRETGLRRAMAGLEAAVPMPAMDDGFAAVLASIDRGADEMMRHFSVKLPAIKELVFDWGAQLANGLVTVATAIGSGFKHIGSAILGVVGGFMVSLGHAMIATAIGVKTLRSIIKANPIASIAAGVALVALGTMLTNSAQKSAERTFGGGGGGGGDGGYAAEAPGAPGRGMPGSEAQTGTLVIQGEPTLNMSDPRQAEALANAIGVLAGRRMIVVYQPAGA